MTLSLVTPDSYPLESSQAATLSITYYNEKASVINDLTVGIVVEHPFKSVSGETYSRVSKRSASGKRLWP